jgi:REP element-mobilizing transposase RayT
MVDNKYHAKNLRQHRHPGDGTFYITKCLKPRIPLLHTEQRIIISDALIHYAKMGRIDLASFVVMPDHWHAVIASNQDMSISKTVSMLQNWISNHTFEYLKNHGASWQKGFYETRIKTSKQFNSICSYIEYNPVAKGLVDNIAAWDASSANVKYSGMVLRPWPWRFLDD